MRATSPRVRPALVLHLVRREFDVRYRRSVLGGLWALAQPVARLVVLSFLFTRILPLGIEDYPAFLFVGLTAWLWFAAAVAAGCSSPVDRRDLVLRPGLPRALVPAVAVLSAGVDYLAALPVLLAYLAFTTGLSAPALLLPVLLVPQVALMLGLAYALAAANVFVRDVKIVVDVLLLLGFYVTPVFFSAEQVPERFSLLLDLNPMAGLIALQREILIDGVLPDWSDLAVTTAVSAAVLVAGYLVYRRASPHFADEL